MKSDPFTEVAHRLPPSPVDQGHGNGRHGRGGAGSLPQGQVGTVARALEASGRAMGGRKGRSRAWSYFPPPRPPQGPQSRSRSLVRRRRLAASGPLPPHLAARFTCGELAALRIVADQVQASGGRAIVTGSCRRTFRRCTKSGGVPN